MQIVLDVAINERIARGWWLKFATRSTHYPAIGGMVAGMPNSPRKGLRVRYLRQYPFPLVAREWFNQSPALSEPESLRRVASFTSQPWRACAASRTDLQPLRSSAARGRFSLQSACPIPESHPQHRALRMAFLVELAGFEPASKQGTSRLSTCLVAA